MLPLLALHSLAARRGDGLRPELLALLRRSERDRGQSVSIEAESQHQSQETARAAETSVASAGDATVQGIPAFAAFESTGSGL